MVTNKRNTVQRSLVLDAVRSMRNHPTSAEVYERVREKHPSISRATVYRNLEALRERGEVTHGLLENGESLYEAARPEEHKHYLICKGCNAMVDLPGCPLHALEEIAGSSGFTVTDHVIQLYGYCKDCQSRRKKE